MSARWENEKSAIGKVQHLREEIEQVGGEIERAEREYDLNKAAELKYGKLPQLKSELEQEEKLAEEAQQSNLLRDKVTEEEIAKVNIPTAMPLLYELDENFKPIKSRGEYLDPEAAAAGAAAVAAQGQK